MTSSKWFPVSMTSSHITSGLILGKIQDSDWSKSTNPFIGYIDYFEHFNFRWLDKQSVNSPKIKLFELLKYHHVIGWSKRRIFWAIICVGAELTIFDHINFSVKCLKSQFTEKQICSKKIIQNLKLRIPGNAMFGLNFDLFEVISIFGELNLGRRIPEFSFLRKIK